VKADTRHMKNRLPRDVDIIGVAMTPEGFVSETPEIKNMTSRELWFMCQIVAAYRKHPQRGLHLEPLSV